MRLAPAFRNKQVVYALFVGCKLHPGADSRSAEVWLLAAPTSEHSIFRSLSKLIRTDGCTKGRAADLSSSQFPLFIDRAVTPSEDLSMSSPGPLMMLCFLLQSTFFVAGCDAFSPGAYMTARFQMNRRKSPIRNKVEYFRLVGAGGRT